MSGSGIVAGCGGPNVDSCRSAAAPTIGQGSGAMNMAPCIPNPQVKVSRSRTVIERSAGTVSWRGPSGRRSTRRSVSSGSRSSTGPSSSSRPVSTSESTATAVIGLVFDEIRNSVSRRIGGPPMAITPFVTTCTPSPRATAATTPGA